MTSSRPRRSRTAHPRRRELGLARTAQMALVAMGGVLLIYAQAVAALGVGEPRYLSHLFEPLRVDVPVDTRGVDPAAVKVGVTVTGVDPAAAAAIESRLHREWKVDARGNYVLRITSDEAIHEPLMQMRVEVGDDHVQAIRELTLLFDPAPIETPAATLLTDATAPAAVAEIAAVEPVTMAAVTTSEIEAEAPVAAAVEPTIVASEPAPTLVPTLAPMLAASEPIAAPVTNAAAAPNAIAALPRAVAVVPKPAAVAVPKPLAAVSAPVAAATRAAPAAPTQRAVRIAPVQPLSAATVPPIARVNDAVVLVVPSLKTSDALISAQIASTHRAQALSGADRWQRLPVTAGDTLVSLAERARGDQTAIPLSMVAMLLRWLNPRSFDGIGSEPLVGAELRFPKPESLAAQIAISGGVWTVDDVTAAAADAAVVPPPSFQVLTPQSAADMAAAMQAGLPSAQDGAIALAAGSALLGARPAAGTGLSSVLNGGRAAGGLAASSALVGGSVLAGLVSMLLMLNMVVGTPAPQASRHLSATVVSRSVAPPAAAHALPEQAVDLASLDFGSLRQQASAVDARGHAES